MGTEMSIELDLIDTNCNNCIHLQRDMEKFKKWEEWNRSVQLKDFELRRGQAFKIAESQPDDKSRLTMLAKANKMVFQFDRSSLFMYGYCAVKNIDVYFLSGICMPQNRVCFKHRRIN